MQSRVFQEQETRGCRRHGAAQLRAFEQLPANALTTTYVAEAMLGRSRSAIDTLRAAGDLEYVKVGRSVKIKVGSIRALLQGAR